jgi:signal-transduction protein with cAMP-binding, CBS, and nucleotidyltransferase domain
MAKHELKEAMPVDIGRVLKAKGSLVLTTTPETPVPDVCSKMRMHNVGALVVSRDGRHVDGLISERDIVLGIAHHGEGVFRQTAGQLMTRSVYTCAPSDTIQHAMALMTNHRVRHLPVVEGGVLAGMISIGDVVKDRLKELELETNVLRDAYLAGH